MKKRVLSLLMACVLVFGTSTTVLAAGSPVVDNSAVSEEAKNEAKTQLNNIPEIKDETTAVAAKDAVATINNDALIAVMQEDATVRNQVSDIEAAYNNTMNITTNAVVLGDAQNIATSISVVGAGLNAKDANTTVELTVAVPDEEATVPEGYENGVQLDISLYVGSTAKSNLDVPVAITMNVPAGVSTSDLVILHYHTATPTEITPFVNGDGTITFAVDGFSTFVFANKVSTPDSGSIIYGSAPAPDTTGTTTTSTTSTTSPKTGETTGIVAICAIMAMAGTAVVVLKRKGATR